MERLKYEVTALSLPRARVGSLVVRELKVHKPCCMAKKKRKGVNVHVRWELRSAVPSHIESLKISRTFLRIFLRCLPLSGQQRLILPFIPWRWFFIHRNESDSGFFPVIRGACCNWQNACALVTSYPTQGELQRTHRLKYKSSVE